MESLPCVFLPRMTMVMMVMSRITALAIAEVCTKTILREGLAAINISFRSLTSGIGNDGN